MAEMFRLTCRQGPCDQDEVDRPCSARLEKNPPLSDSCLFAVFAELVVFLELCG